VSNEGKKKEQLGMNTSTARNRLIKTILHKMAVQLGQDVCHQCGGKIDVDGFSIEHKTPWLDSESPTELYFDLDNIAFSHQSCNSGAARKPTKLGIPRNERTVQMQRERRSKMSADELKADRRRRYEKYGH
jgi:hypothetical protein